MSSYSEEEVIQWLWESGRLDPLILDALSDDATRAKVMEFIKDTPNLARNLENLVQSRMIDLVEAEQD